MIVLCTLSIVAPAYNESTGIDAFYERLQNTLLCIGMDYEVIFINDGSDDATWRKMNEIRDRNCRVKLLNFSRNFGHEAAILAGLLYSSGDATVIIDTDLQDPPEIILQLVQTWKTSYDIVYCKRSHRCRESICKKITSYFFYRIYNKCSDTSIYLDTGDFCLLSRRVVDTVISLPDKDLFLRGMINWVGFKKTYISFVRDGRYAGKTKYTYKKLLMYASMALLSSSTKIIDIYFLFLRVLYSRHIRFTPRVAPFDLLGN